MQIGSLNHQIQLQNLIETNSFGSVSQSYTPGAMVWAEVKSQRGSEAFETARRNAKETIRVKIRYRSDVTAKSRLIWEGQSYNVIHVDRSLRKKGELWLTAELSGAL